MSEFEHLNAIFRTAPNSVDPFKTILDHVRRVEGGRNQEMASAFLAELAKDEAKGKGIFFSVRLGIGQ